jgi:hypothetical protein
LLEQPAVATWHTIHAPTARRAQQRADLVAARQLDQQRLLIGDQQQLVGTRLQPQPAPTPGQFMNIGDNVLWHRVLGEASQALDHRVGRQTSGGGIPERQRCDSVGVNILWALLELGERRNRLARLGEARALDLQQQCAVALDDQWVSRVVGWGMGHETVSIALS